MKQHLPNVVEVVVAYCGFRKSFHTLHLPFSCLNDKKDTQNTMVALLRKFHCRFTKLHHRETPIYIREFGILQKMSKQMTGPYRVL